ncbi:MAG: phosphodiester glycosidase family protein [Solirubrobacterales bacterium]|nr:phosphodiester glycosidase family protein [Solirubrobacterales bacterium]
MRVALDDGLGTTLHALRLPRPRYTARVVALEPSERLVEWCVRRDTEYALIGGFYLRAEGAPLGDLQIDGRPSATRPFDAPWDRIRACVHSQDGEVSLRSRAELPDAPGGDLLQAGPMLVGAGLSLIEPGIDPEGFSAGSHQFDSDITVGRYPRAALGLSPTELIAVACDGRAEHESGLSLSELARAMIALGAQEAINLDGGGSASLVARGRLVNTPREEHGIRILGGRVVPTALRFTLR